MDHSVLDDSLLPLCAAPRWYVGLSGGLDSTVLLHLVAAWRDAHPEAPPLAAMHVEHGLAAQGDDWAGHCAATCAALDLPCIRRAVTVAAGASLEAQARAARYRAFEEQLADGEVLFLAHHLDDQVETFLLRLLRGAGLEGLAAMPARRALGAGFLVRPLLAHRRDDLARYAQAHGLAHVHDPSNADTRFDRNFLRAEVLPLLAGRWPGYRATIARAGEHLGVAAAQLRAAAGPLPTCSSALGDPGLLLAPLLAAGDRAAATLLRTALSLWGVRAPDRSALDEFLRQLRDAGEDASPELRTADYTLRRFQDGVYLLPGGEDPTGALALGPGEVVGVPGVGRLALLPAAGEGIALARGERLEVRFRSGGEYCRPRGRAAAPLKKWLQAWNVPPWWRARLPLLYRGDELVAIADLALCESPHTGPDGAPGERWIFSWERPESGRGD